MTKNSSSGDLQRVRGGAALIKTLRQIHLYLGVFCAPALLFFAVTGVLQTFSLHQASRTSDYKPPQWLAVAAQIHKNQTTQLRKPPPQGAKGQEHGPASAQSQAEPAQRPTPSAQPPATPAQPQPQPQPTPQGPKHNPLPEKIFFAIVSFSFLVSVLTGVYLAYKYNRGVWTVTALLLAGVIVPIVLLFV